LKSKIACFGFQIRYGLIKGDLTTHTYAFSMRSIVRQEGS